MHQSRNRAHAPSNENVAYFSLARGPSFHTPGSAFVRTSSDCRSPTDSGSDPTRTSQDFVLGSKLEVEGSSSPSE